MYSCLQYFLSRPTEVLAACMRIHSKGEAKANHSREISVLPTCSEPPEAQHWADSWI